MKSLVHIAWRGAFAALLLTGTLVFAQGPGIVSDHFNTPLLNTELWSFENPRGDAGCAMTGSQLSICLPAGVSHDIVEGGNFAPRIMQNVQDPANFDVFVKFDAAMPLQYQMQGVFIWQDSLNFLRLEYYGDGTCINRLAWSFANGVHQSICVAGFTNSTGPLFMRIQRQQDMWTVGWSTDGLQYSTSSTFTRSMTVTKIGLYAGNAGYPAASSPAFTGLFEYFLTSNPLPIQLASFSACSEPGNRVQLDWRTISESNNYGFEVQRSQDAQSGFVTLPNAFVAGHGTTLQPQSYTWTDANAVTGTAYYRLKQMDLDGTIRYTDPVQSTTLTGVAERLPQHFGLEQNYPNPFNPETTIAFSVETTGKATLTVYNTLGQEVAVLFNDVAEAGRSYVQKFSGQSLSSGAYFCRLESGGKSDLKKLILMK